MSSQRATSSCTSHKATTLSSSSLRGVVTAKLWLQPGSSWLWALNIPKLSRLASLEINYGLGCFVCFEEMARSELAAPEPVLQRYGVEPCRTFTGRTWRPSTFDLTQEFSLKGPWLCAHPAMQKTLPQCALGLGCFPGFPTLYREAKSDV
ncbi:hypothetical protein H8959_010835 [Pygathrix nigripes]